MQELLTLSHHAYLLEGERDTLMNELFRVLEDTHRVVRAGNPDMYVHECTSFGIDDARFIRERGQFSGFGGGKKVFILSFETMTHDAQNALLKTIEEPTPDTHFFFVTRTGDALLATVRSRMVRIAVPEAKLRGDSAFPKLSFGNEFLAASLAERMKIVTPLHSDKKKKEDGSNKVEAHALLDAIERTLYEKGNITDAKTAKALVDVLSAKKRLLGRSPILKPLLEHLALTLPNDDDQKENV